MNKVCTITAALLLLAVYGFAAPSFSAHIGGDFFNYEDNFLDLGITYINPLGQDMELYLSGHFGVRTRTENGEIVADFLYPLEAGLNFLFPFSATMTGLFGLGITPQFLVADETSFYLGPTVKCGLRVRIHPRMAWMAEARQDLVIGAPKWINTGTRLHTGIVFTF
ncbi:MAG: hypothetical protein JXB03_00405 [Spirochaetales bacterium]|nr:hypothetical protein [Spirochaetales bacterium]